MISPPVRRRRRLARFLVASALLAAPASGRAFVPGTPSAPIVAIRGVPSSLAAEYGAAVPLGDPSVAGLFAVPTRWGFEIRDAVTGDPDLVARFRTSGQIGELTVDPPAAYLMAGARGIVAVDLADPMNPVAVGSRDDLGIVTAGAASPDGYGLLAGAGGALHVLARTAPGNLDLLTTLRHPDGRLVRSIRARADSFLVASERLAPTPRLFFTLYRLAAGAVTPESLREVPVPLQTALDVSWNEDIAFAAAGNSGVLVVNVRTGATAIVPAPGGRFVRALDANDSLVVAALSGAGIAKFRRSGADGALLVNPTVESVELEPMRIALHGTRVLISAQDIGGAQDPDEIGRSAILFRDLDAPVAIPPLGGTGRTRRIAWDRGLAYVADYTGGLRIYRAGGGDSSLVGVLPASAGARVVDIALDPERARAFLASGSAGLQVVDVSDPSAPSLLASLPLPELASAVAVVDSELVIVGRRGTVQTGLTFVDVRIPTAPLARGQVSIGITDPRAIAVKDTIAFVADASAGLLSVGFGNPDAPGLVGPSTGMAARDLHLAGNTLLVGTRSSGLQIVDVSNPAAPFLRSQLATPPIFGVARSGTSAALFLGDQEVLVVDIADLFEPRIRGPVAAPGFSRDGLWIADTLLVASSFALERFEASPGPDSVAPLTLELDSGLLLPEVRIRWSQVSLPGMAGLNVDRDVVSVAGTSEPAGARVNPSLLPPATVELVDPGVQAGATYRYRLEVFFQDGSSRKVAEATISISSAPGVGRAHPNPYRVGAGVVTVPFRAAAAASVEWGIFDVRGRLIARDRVSSPPGGFGSVTWDGRDRSGRTASSGVYYLRLRGGGLDDARTIVLLR